MATAAAVLRLRVAAAATSFLRRRAYCTTFSSSFPLPSAALVRCRPPWILLPRTDHDESRDLCRLYSVRDGAEREVPLPRGLRYTCCLGSSPDGWLVVLNPSYTPILLNPATGATAHLPSIDQLDHLPGMLDPPPYPCPMGELELELHPLAEREEAAYTYKATSLGHSRRRKDADDAAKLRMERFVSLNSVTYKRDVPYEGTVVADRGLYFGKTVVDVHPSSTAFDYTAVGIYGRNRQLAIAKAGDKRWLSLRTQEPLFQDVIYHKGWFYAVHGQGSVEAIDPNAPPARKTELLGSPPMRRAPGRRYLAESGGELFLINRLMCRVPIDPEKGGTGYRTSEFEVFRLDLSGPRWVALGSLGKHALFIGGNHSVSLSVEDFPELKGDSIYFMDDYWEHCLWFNHSKINDFGVYNVVNRSFDPVASSDSLSCQPAPIWVIPSAAICESVQLPSTQGEPRDLQGEETSYRAPWLLFPRGGEDEKNGICRLYSIQDKTELTVHLPQDLCWSCCLGSSNGWLVTVDSKLTPHLTNPLTGSQIPLPSIDNLPGTESAHSLKIRVAHNCITTESGLYIGKAVVSWNTTAVSLPLSPLIPAKREHTVVAIQGPNRHLVCTREGDWSWSLLNTEHSGFQDVMHYNGMFYAVTGGRGFVEAFDLNGHLPDISEELLGPKIERQPQKRYLVESLGNLLLVARMIAKADFSSGDNNCSELGFDYDPNYRNGNLGFRTTGFRIFKLDLGVRNWHELKSLGNRSLILGGNQSLSISVSDYPELRANCIYFTDDHWEHNLSPKHVIQVDSGVYHLGDGTIEPLAPFHSHSTLLSPFFVVPAQHQPAN